MRRLTVLAVSTAVALALCLGGFAPSALRTEARGSSAANESTEAKIVFSRGGWADGAIWTVESDATGLKRATRPPKGSLDMYPTWSPTRDRIAFFRLVPVGEDFRGDTTYRSDLMLMKADGKALRRLVGGVYGGSGEQGPAWSPDGDRLAFIKQDGRKPWIWTIGADGSGARRLVSGTDINHPMWSPNGREIAFDQWTGEQQEFFVTNADGAGLRKLIPGFRRTTYWSVDWSPNGSQIALLASADNDVSLYIVSRNGRGLRRLVGGVSSKDLNTPEWSPDGSKLLIERGGSGIGGRKDFVFVVNVADGQLRRVATDTDFSEWSPDGRTVVFVKAQQQGDGDLHVASAMGGPSRRIARAARGPDW